MSSGRFLGTILFMKGFKELYTTENQIFTFRYSELGLKGRQRSYWEFILKNNISYALKQAGVTEFIVGFEQKRGYVVLLNSQSSDEPPKTRKDSTESAQSTELERTVLAILTNTPGVKWAGRLNRLVGYDTMQVEDIEALGATISDGLARLYNRTTIGDVEVKRYYKGVNFTSDQLRRLILRGLRGDSGGKSGGAMNNRRKLYVFVEEDGIYAVLREEGIGGLPVSSVGKGIVLFSGGIDSPVAAYYAFKRGIRADLLHFAPHLDGIENTKIFKLYKVLKRYNPYLKLYVTTMPSFGRILHRNKVYNPVVVFRRIIIRFGIQLLMELYRRGAIVTGDNIGQVASQTFSNLVAQNAILCGDSVYEKVLFFRPLVGFDKEEIVNVAQKIGTYEFSIQEYADCCSLINKGAKTQTRLDKLVKAEQSLPIDRLVHEAWDNLRIIAE